ncbi:MAG: coenzyme F420-0:L-glutamate ligase [Patescibacteria group bacterium]
MIVRPIHTRVFKEGEDLLAFITKYIPRLKEGSVLVVTSKIAALSEHRTSARGDARAKEKLIRAESEWARPTKYVWLTVKDGMMMPNAGVDESNGNGKIILLPRDSFKAAETIRTALKKQFKLKRLGVIVTDSRTLPLRAGVVGVALGYAGFSGVRDYRGKPDIFGRKLVMTMTDVADALASAAVLEMGEGKERRPLAIIEGAPVEFREKITRNELRIALADDMYRPLFKRFSKK